MEKEWLFDDEHRMFRETVRKWVAAELAPYADEWEKKGEFPIELFLRAGELGFFAGGLPENYGGVGGDFRYPTVFSEEMARCKSGGVSAGLGLHGLLSCPP
jgi:alkylation response protein AidB-like acyl-CoA dehydrogenase